MFTESWPIAFAATVFVEGVVAFALSRLLRFKMPWSELAIVNLITHPLAFVLVAESLGFGLVECGVILIEIAGYGLLGRVTWRQAVGLGLVCNLMSLSLSFL